MLLTEQTPVNYVVMVNGQRVCMPQQSRTLAEAILIQLPEQQRVLAEIKAVTPSGAEVLFG